MHGVQPILSQRGGDLVLPKKHEVLAKCWADFGPAMLDTYTYYFSSSVYYMCILLYIS